MVFITAHLELSSTIVPSRMKITGSIKSVPATYMPSSSASFKTQEFFIKHSYNILA